MISIKAIQTIFHSLYGLADIDFQLKNIKNKKNKKFVVVKGGFLFQLESANRQISKLLTDKFYKEMKETTKVYQQKLFRLKSEFYSKFK